VSCFTSVQYIFTERAIISTTTKKRSNFRRGYYRAGLWCRDFWRTHHVCTLRFLFDTSHRRCDPRSPRLRSHCHWLARCSAGFFLSIHPVCNRGSATKLARPDLSVESEYIVLGIRRNRALSVPLTSHNSQHCTGVEGAFLDCCPQDIFPLRSLWSQGSSYRESRRYP
jgi:hypothetical protein